MLRRGGLAERRARRALLLGLCALGTGALDGCYFHPGRGALTDFLIKDYDLPPYRPEQAAFHRGRRSVTPSDVSGGLGGMAGALAGGRLRSWKASASGALGGLAGAAVGAEYSFTERAEPLPAEYEVLALALPVVATDPNQGVTLGVLPVAIFQEGSRITDIWAPDLTYNAIDGFGGTFRMLRFFSSDAGLDLNLGAWTNGAHDYQLAFNQRRLGPNDALFFRVAFKYQTVLSTRFYGIGNDTKSEAEASYALRHTLGTASLGFELPLHFDLELQERVASYSIGPGQLSDLPSARASFANVPGVAGDRQNILAHRVRLTFDNRDSRTAPTEGIYGELVYEVGDDTLGGDVGFQRFAGALTVLIPKLRKRFTTVVHLAAWYMTGDDAKIPFYELTTVGGKSTNRGYGAGRFVDKHGLTLNIEERWNVVSFEMAGVELVFQLAGFVDVGRVYSDDDARTLKDMHVAGGGAVRLVVPDSELVASIDMGFSDEGSAVFVGLDYPF